MERAPLFEGGGECSALYGWLFGGAEGKADLRLGGKRGECART